MILNCPNVQDCLVGEHQAVWLQELVARVQHTVQHGFVQEKLAHPLTHDYVHFVVRTGQLFDVLHLAFDYLDPILEVVQPDNLLGLGGDIGEFDGLDLLGPCLGAEHGQDASAAAHVHDNLVFEEVCVFED